MKKRFIFLITLLFLKLALAQEDCSTAITLCGNSAINYTPVGIGNTLEPVGIGTCLSTEHHSVWYKFTIATSGTLTFDLVPTGPVDYDWAIFGPNASCNNFGAPIRCNASGYFVPTGLNMTNFNTSSGAGNTDPYCRYMDVVAGETYYLYLDNWSTTVYTFNLTWGGTATFVSPFTDPILTPNPFIAPGNQAPNPSDPNEINICSNNAVFDFSTLTPGILNGNPNFTVSYYSSANNATTGTNPILTPTNVNTFTTYYYNINYQDPTNPNNAANECKQTGSFVFVNNTIIANISTSSTFLCPNGTVTLTSNSTSGNTWSTGETTQSITVNAAGTYSLTTSNGYCTSAPTNVTITNATDPNVQISGNLVLCSNTSTTLTASATGTGNTFSWSNGTNGASTTVSSPGTYTVTVTTPQGCQFQESATVVQGSVPVVNNTNLSECSTTNTAVFDLISAQSAISTTSGTTFIFYQNLADANAANSNFISSPSSFTSGNSTVYVLVSTGTCAIVAQLQLNVIITPTPVITASSTTVCAGNPVTLTSNYPTGNTWSTGQTSQSITVNTAGTYTLTNASGSCISAPVSITIAAAADPNVQISGNLSFCEGSSTTLIASATGTGNTFSWSNGVNGASNMVTSGGNYTVTVTTPEGCQFQESVNVTMNATPVVNISNPSQIDCNNSQITLNASGSTFEAGANIQWTTSGGGTIVSGGNSLNPTVNSAGTYTLTITNTNGCSSQASVNVINNSNPPTIFLNASATSICEGESVILTASGAQTYTWTGMTGSGNTQTLNPTTTTTYTVTGMGANGCQGNSASITIEVVPAIESTLSDIEFCKGDSGILDAGAGTDYTYQWSTGETTQSISVDQEGTYVVTINNGVCTKSFSAQASFIKTPSIESINYDGSTLVIIATDDANLPLQYSIDGGITWQDSNIFYGVSNNIEVNIHVRTRGENCSSSLNYFAFIMQNVITPNGDGHNDVIDFRSVINNPGFSAEIYDRYGKLIFKASPKNPVWDGKDHGMILPSTSYWYILKWNNTNGDEPVLLNGWILLKAKADN